MTKCRDIFSAKKSEARFSLYRFEPTAQGRDFIGATVI